MLARTRCVVTKVPFRNSDSQAFRSLSKPSVFHGFAPEPLSTPPNGVMHSAVEQDIGLLL